MKLFMSTKSENNKIYPSDLREYDTLAVFTDALPC